MGCVFQDDKRLPVNEDTGHQTENKNEHAQLNDTNGRSLETSATKSVNTTTNFDNVTDPRMRER